MSPRVRVSSLSPATARAWRCTVALLAVVVLQLARPAPAAHAHAELVRSEPADSAALAEAPREVRLSFSEPLADGLATFHLVDTLGQAVAMAAPAADPADPAGLAVDVPQLPAGAYTLDWSVVSEAGGHPARGRLVFAVGDAPPPAPVRGTGFGLAALEGPLNGLALAGLLGLVGGFVVRRLVLEPTHRARRGGPGAAVLSRASRRVLLLSAGCALLALASGALILGWQALNIADTRSDLAAAPTIGWRLLTSTRAGELWLVRQALLIVSVAAIVRLLRGDQAAARRANARPASAGVLEKLLLACLAQLLVSQAANGHAATVADSPGLAVAADALHLLAAAAWAGGLVALTISWLPLVSRSAPPELLREVWRRFSRLALVAVGVLVGTGLFAVARQVPSLDAVPASDYGRLLLGKLVMVGGMGALGVLMAGVVHPRVLAVSARLARHIPRLTRLETSLGLAVILAAGLLAAASPPRASVGPLAARPAALSQVVGDLLVGLDVRPNRPGPNVLLLRVASQRRPALADVDSVRLVLQSPDGGVLGLDTLAERQAPGVYRVAGDALNVTGDWRATVSINRPTLPVARATFTWTVGGQAAEQAPLLPSTLGELPDRLAASILVLTLIGGVVLVRYPKHASGRGPAVRLAGRVPYSSIPRQGAAS